ncbi:MAG: hypothetical protein ABW123_06155 [Cystobacter sp.]
MGRMRYDTLEERAIDFGGDEEETLWVVYSIKRCRKTMGRPKPHWQLIATLEDDEPQVLSVHNTYADAREALEKLRHPKKPEGTNDDGSEFPF